MRKLEFYLDTTVFNFVFVDDAPKERQVTVKFFEQIDKVNVYISDLVLKEIGRCPQPRQANIARLLAKTDYQEIYLNQEAEILADHYLQQGIIPVKYRDDAVHIAIASVAGMDVLLSWNFAHMVKLKTKREVMAVNLLMGYNSIEILSPWEVVDDIEGT